MLDPKGIGQRLLALRKDREWSGAFVAEKYRKRFKLKTFTDQSLFNYEKGKGVTQPKVFNNLVAFWTEEGEKNVERYLLFSELRSAQLTGERRIAEYVNSTEIKALQFIRRTNIKDHKELLGMMEIFASMHPAPRAIIANLPKK